MTPAEELINAISRLISGYRGLKRDMIKHPREPNWDDYRELARLVDDLETVWSKHPEELARRANILKLTREIN